MSRARSALSTFLAGLTLSGAVCVSPAPAMTVIGTLPPVSTEGDLLALRSDLRLAYYTYCVSDLFGLEGNPTMRNACGTLALVIEALRSEHDRLCRDVPETPECGPTPRTAGPSTERRE